MKMARVSFLLCFVCLIGMTGFCHAEALEVSSGITYLSAGSHTYDYVSITGGALYLNGDVTITCNGSGTGYFSLTGAGAIRCSTTYAQVQTSDGAALSGADGGDGAGYNGSGGDGESGESFSADNGPGGYSLTVYADDDITLLGSIFLPGSDGRRHWNSSSSYAGYGGDGGAGTGGAGDWDDGGHGGTGGHGGDSQGGHGGDAGSVFFETLSGVIDAGQSSSSRLNIQLLGGEGGMGGRGGSGGDGGHGGNSGEYGIPGNGGNGGDGGDSLGGDGGDGGGITFRAATIYDVYLSKSLTGGDGGDADTAGARGNFNYGGNDGNNTYGGDGSYGVAGSAIDGTDGSAGSYTATIVPEPSTAAMLLAVLMGLAAYRRR